MCVKFLSLGDPEEDGGINIKNYFTIPYQMLLDKYKINTYMKYKLSVLKWLWPILIKRKEQRRISLTKKQPYPILSVDPILRAGKHCQGEKCFGILAMCLTHSLPT